MNVQFSLASAHDEARLLELMQEFYQVEHLPFQESLARQSLRQLLADRRHGLVYLIRADELLVGYVVLTFSFSLEFHGRDAFVDEIYLRPSHRKLGLGRETLRYIETICLEEQIKALHLEVDHANTRALQVYQAAGFRDQGRYLLTKWLQE